MGKLCLTGATGKLGLQVLKALLENNLINPKELVISTSSPADNDKFKQLDLVGRGVTIRRATYDDPASLEEAFAGCEKLFIVSTPAIQLDFNDAPLGEGREKHHFSAIDAATRAGVSHIYYTSLAFGGESVAGVMQAHLRTESYLRKLGSDGLIKYTIIREGLYSESWPLYLGYYDLGKESRTEILLAGDGPISWISIPDLGFATACVLTAPSDAYAGQCFYLSSGKAYKLEDLARLVSQHEGRSIRTKVVPRDEYERYYLAYGKEGIRGNVDMVKWWSSTYDALKTGECEIEDNTLQTIFEGKGKSVKPFEDTIKEMYH